MSIDSIKVGAGLVRAGVVVNEPVPILADKSILTIKTMMGAVKAGAFYVILDIGQPANRLKQIIETLNPKVLITTKDTTNGTEEFLNEIGFIGKKVYAEELICEEVSEGDMSALACRRAMSKNTDPLYCIFTSGSTGTPKGVVVSHRSVIDFIEYFTEIFGINNTDIIGNQAPWDFDVSVKDIYSGLKTGATVVIIPRKYFSIPMQLLDLLEEKKVTNLTWAVSALCMITTFHGFDYKVPTSVKRVLFSGESMPIKHLKEWRNNLPEAMYANLYGPTEITCNCKYHIIEREYEVGETLPIGRAFPNESVFLIDEEDRQVTEPDKLGEICVTGTALALGYYNNPEQTAKVFVVNPLNKAYPEMMYRTGDLGYFDREGMLYFASRKDFQIKHMGHRIELGEIENAMEKVPEIVRSCCMFDSIKNKIVAYYQGEIEKKDLKKQLGEWLPAFMLPNRFIQMESMPLTKNGKIDRNALKNM